MRLSLGLRLDILNLPNFLCKDWGLYKQVSGNALLSFSKGQYTYNTVNGVRHLSTYQDFLNMASTYQLMFTVRYLFN